MGYFKKELKCKIFEKRLLNETLEEQVNFFFKENSDIEIEYVFKDAESIMIIYKK